MFPNSNAMQLLKSASFFHLFILLIKGYAPRKTQTTWKSDLVFAGSDITRS